MSKQDRLKEIETQLKLNRKYSLKGNNLNIAKKEILTDYNERISKLDCNSYLQTAHLHYFVSRQLFINHIGEYAYFCAHQTIENYLKGTLKYFNINPPNKHILIQLLNVCRENSEKTNFEFLHSNYVNIIIEIFEPFYEFARYPVQNIRPKDGLYMMSFPRDMEILDYFVYKMNEVLSPNEDWSYINHKLFSTKQQKPDFYSKFFDDNINFE